MVGTPMKEMNAKVFATSAPKVTSVPTPISLSLTLTRTWALTPIWDATPMTAKAVIGFLSRALPSETRGIFGGTSVCKFPH